MEKNNNVTKQEFKKGIDQVQRGIDRVQKGFDRTIDRVIKENNKSIENLAVIVKAGFDEQGKILAEHGNRLDSLEKGQTKLEQGQAEIKLQLSRMELDLARMQQELADLRLNIEKLEQKVDRIFKAESEDFFILQRDVNMLKQKQSSLERELELVKQKK